MEGYFPAHGYLLAFGESTGVLASRKGGRYEEKPLIIAMFLGGCQSAHAGMFITEFMYSGYADSTTKASEFIEFTNVGSTRGQHDRLELR